MRMAFGRPAPLQPVRRFGALDLLVLALIVLELLAGLAAALQGERTAGLAIAVVGPLLTIVIYRNFILTVSLLGLIGEVREGLREQSPRQRFHHPLPAPGNARAQREITA